MIPSPARIALPSLLLGGTALLLAAAAALGGGAAAPASAQAAPPGTFCTNPYPFPRAGFDHPQPAKAVESWVASRNDLRAREHGWYLFAGVNQAIGGKPIWRSWCTSTQAFAPGGPGLAAGPAPGRSLSLKQRRLARGLTTRATAASVAASPPPPGEDPIQLPDAPIYPVPKDVYTNQAYLAAKCTDGTAADPLANGPTLLNEGNVAIVGVIYNDPAYRWLRDRSLYEAATLDRLLKKGDRIMPQMPSGSIVLKPMLWPVQQGDAYTALPLWDDLPPSADDGQYAGFEVPGLWSRAVAVTVRPRRGAGPVRVTYLHGVEDSLGKPIKPITYERAAIVGVDQFYHLRPDLRAMAPCDRALLDQSAYWAFKREFRQGDYLILIAMHVITKEQPDWTFQSFWWHDKPDYGPYAAARPSLAPNRAAGPWRHYLMASTYGMPERPGGDSWPIAYNPYIELAADHPIRTNCMNCHQRATWPSARAHYEVAGVPPDALQIYTGANKMFDGTMRTDAMWTVVNAAVPPPAAGASGGRR
jgi:hypothetical protein